MKRKKTRINVWFGLMVWVHPKMTKTASSTTGALLRAVSQSPIYWLHTSQKVTDPIP
jgi:hypothetical protein